MIVKEKEIALNLSNKRRMTKWRKIDIGEFADFNPAEKIEKGKLAKKVPMAMLTEFQRKIKGFEFSNYQSGPKFRNGDTLVAKITPCLENGKTAQVDILEKGEVAFGSSEFIVLRENENSINNYIFYLARSPVFRERAISCMEGTSGRKRINEGALKRQEISVPDKLTQQKIASVLSALDEKIELNNRINDNLKQMAKALYDYWFVQFDFPDKDGKPYKSNGGMMVWDEELKRKIPEGWRVNGLNEILELEYGKPLKECDRSGQGFPVVGSNGIVGYHSESFVKGPGIVIGRKGSAGEITWVDEDFFPIDTTYYIKDKMGSELLVFHYYLLKKLNLKKIESSSAVPGLNRNIVYSLKSETPPNLLLIKFNNTVNPIFSNIASIKKQNQLLIFLRDWLLPMLMNGQVTVE
ncbi:MAG: restriction endonuclease subunit S [Terrimonas sp.]|nr:restriction endonuclease subunit S [Terrimonas sp.]